MDISNDAISNLREAAKLGASHAYAPYSKFPVGAAVLTADGKIYSGSNVENASFGLTVCAERNAIFNAVASGSREVVAVVVYTPSKTPTTPCGACRQVIREFGTQVRIICLADTDVVVDTAINDLLPHSFGPDNLRHDRE